MAKNNRSRRKKKQAPQAKLAVRTPGNKILLKVSLIIFSLASVAVVAGLAYQANQKAKKQAQLIKKIAAIPSYKTGGVYQCSKIPAFVASNGLRQPVAVDTQQTQVLGPMFREIRENGRAFKDPSWAQTGNVGPVILDKRGDVFVISIPSVSLDHNPPSKQNRVYKIDGVSAQISVMAELPGHDLPNPKNPFGTSGQAYDCETDSLYVASLAGSTAFEEIGKLHQINPRNGEILDTYSGLDVLGVGIFNTPKEKRLYYGSARNSGVFSIVLDKSGGFASSPRYEFALSDIPEGSTTKAKKIRFSVSKQGQHRMTVSELDFDFRLSAQNTPLIKKYIFEFDLKNERWKYLRFNWN